jgi:hypothetical protein
MTMKPERYTDGDCKHFNFIHHCFNECPDLYDYVAYLFELLDNHRRQVVDRHLRRCPKCHAELEGVLAGIEMYLRETEPVECKCDFFTYIVRKNSTRTQIERRASCMCTDRIKRFDGRVFCKGPWKAGRPASP